MINNFPSDFKWGVATSSYQIEGATNVDGRGISIWDTFSATPGKVVNGETGDMACDHYNRYKEDIAIMRDLGVQSYRFSIAWPRLFPKGDHVREQRGFDFYNRLIDELIANDIEPMITLYHWDLPQTLQDTGGWANREIVNRFVDYSVAAVEAFGDRVENWITLNEPWCVSWLGYMLGVHAPGVQNLDHAIASSHHTALAHGLASTAMRKVNPAIKIGIAPNMTNYRVDDPSNPDLMELSGLMDSHINRWWIDAFTHGRYPRNLADFYGEKLQKYVLPGDMDSLRVQTDFLGINYYSDSFIGTPRPEDKPISEGGLFPFPQRSNGTPPEPYTDMGWPITPVGIRDLLVRVSKEWPNIEEIAITENGAAYPEVPDANGEIRDERRIEYIESHIEAVGQAIAAGAPVKRYYAWSFMDNFEWAEGYAKRFGIVHVDFDTQERTPKESARVFSSIIHSHSAFWETVSQS
jgi:beta-glucosidase